MQMANANPNPLPEAKADSKTPERGPGNPGHSLTIDSGWRGLAETTLAFVQRFVTARAAAT